MKSVKIKSYAKVNLTLEIVGSEGGYHLLDSLLASIDLFDVIHLKKRKDKLSSIVMHGMDSESIPPQTNNALKAAEAFSEKFGVCGVDITVYKNIPMGAGLGGSSADAAGVLRGMAKLYGIDDKEGIEALADSLGSDTKYMLSGGFVRMQERGTKLSRVEIFERLHLLLILPKSSVSTSACYKEYDLDPKREGINSTENCIRALQEKRINEAGRYLTNDLYPPATRLDPSVNTALLEAQSFSPLGAAMTGSGSCVFALFETRELCEWAKSRYRGKSRTLVVRTIVPEKEEKRSFRNPFVWAGQ